jgi:hypothetical protein
VASRVQQVEAASRWVSTKRKAYALSRLLAAALRSRALWRQAEVSCPPRNLFPSPTLAPSPPPSVARDPVGCCCSPWPFACFLPRSAPPSPPTTPLHTPPSTHTPLHSRPCILPVPVDALRKAHAGAVSRGRTLRRWRAAALQRAHCRQQCQRIAAGVAFQRWARWLRARASRRDAALGALHAMTRW